MSRLLNMASAESVTNSGPGVGDPTQRRWEAPGKTFAEGVLMKCFRLRRVAQSLIAVGALLALGLWVTAQDAGSKKGPDPDKQVDKKVDKKNPYTDKLYTLEFREKQ